MRRLLPLLALLAGCTAEVEHSMVVTPLKDGMCCFRCTCGAGAEALTVGEEGKATMVRLRCGWVVATQEKPVAKVEMKVQRP